MRQIDHVGNPYEDLVRVVLDHVALGGELLDNGFDAPATAPQNLGFATLSDNETPDVKTAIVTPQVQLDLEEGRTHSQFRLRFQINTNLDGAQDFAVFADGEDKAGFGVLPELRVSYTR